MQLKCPQDGRWSESTLSKKGTFLCRNGQASPTPASHASPPLVNPCPACEEGEIIHHLVGTLSRKPLVSQTHMI